MDASAISLGLAFLAGLISFLSPCMLPLVPIYLTQLVGQSVSQARDASGERPARLRTFGHALLFVLGFTFAFVALGASASALGSLLRAYQFQLRQIGGVVLVLIGLYLMGLLRIPFLYRQKRLEFHPTRPGYLMSLLMGLIFAIGWTPCISLVLGSVLSVAATAATLRQGVLLLLAYSLGMGVPFLLLGLGLNQISRFLKRLSPYLGRIQVVAGLVMIGVGVMIFFNWLAYLNHYFTPVLPLLHG
jgi:cytochrome c-type biogenesis protein